MQEIAGESDRTSVQPPVEKSKLVTRRVASGKISIHNSAPYGNMVHKYNYTLLDYPSDLDIQPLVIPPRFLHYRIKINIQK